MIEHWNYSGLPPVERYNAAVDRANELLKALKAARDLLVGCQKHAGQIPGQGYSTTLTEHEMALARGIESVDAIISQVESVYTIVRRGHDRDCESELTSHGYTECRCHERAGICCCRKNPCVCLPDTPESLPSVATDIRQGLRRWVQSNKYGRIEDAKAEGK
jgi:hypothetical protein